MAVALVAFVFGALISLSTSWVLVSRLERLGERLGLSEALLGLVTALAADAPEITAAVTALARNQHAVGAGIVLGSNVFNLAALLGLAAVVAGRTRMHRDVVLLGGAVAMWVAVVCVVAVVGLVPGWAALALCLLVLVPYGVLLGAPQGLLRRVPLPRRSSRWLSAAVADEEMELVEAIRPSRGTPVDAVTAGACLVAVIASSVAMERAATSLGNMWSLAGIVVGGLILAAVTSLPNAVAGGYLAARGRAAALLSTALNSNALNVVVGLLLPATVTGLASPSGTGTLVATWYATLTALTLLLAWLGRGLRRPDGWVIIAGYAAFVAAVVALA